MAKKFDFTQLGGFPADQQTLSYMQESYSDMVKWLGLAGDLSQTAVILAGVNYSTNIDGNNNSGWSNGWVVIDGELLQFIGGVGGNFVVIESKTPLIFEGGVPKDVKINKYVQVNSTEGLPIANYFTRFTDLLGERSKSDWISEAVNQFGWSGNIDYKLNKLTRQVYLKGLLTNNTAQSILNPPERKGLITLPNGFRPQFRCQFLGFIIGNSPAYPPQILDSNEIQYIRSLIFSVETNGTITITPLLPKVGINSYSITLNHIFPLD